MLIYKGSELTKIAAKQGGKNQNEVNGFYQNEADEEFFIKKPSDLRELFAELLVGLLLQEFKKRKLIDPIYHSSLICADVIKFEDGTYGIIQPKIVFTELYKIIGTGYWNGLDRDPFTEMFLGSRYYPLLIQTGQYFGLAISLMLSLLVGDNSVHSGNIVCWRVFSVKGKEFTRFARIDWGAALRYFGHPDNNINLLYPFEYQGWLNLKSYTKGYFLNYKRILGLYAAISEQAKILNARMDKVLLADIVISTLKKIPIDLIDEKAKRDISQYLCMESFNEINFAEGNFQSFSQAFVDLLSSRLTKITELQELMPLGDNSSTMFIEHAPMAVVLKVNQTTPFPEQMKSWKTILDLADERSFFDFNTIDLAVLVEQFNCFIDLLLDQFEGIHSSESTILRRLFTVKPNLSLRFVVHMQSSQDYIMKVANPLFKALVTVLNIGFNAVVTVKVLRETQRSMQSEADKVPAIRLLFSALNEQLSNFQYSLQTMSKFLQEENSLTLSQNTLPEAGDKQRPKDCFFNTEMDERKSEDHSNPFQCY